MIYRKTVLEQPELHRSGLLQIKLGLLMVEDNAELSCAWHRTAITLDGDVQVVMDAVNAHLAIMEPPMPPLPQEDIDFIKQCHVLLKSRFTEGAA
jgi:predicted nucleotidyltransferase